jgi:hypothetical protein
MTESFSDTHRRLYADPADYIDSDHPSVVTFAAKHAAGEACARARALYTAVCDGIRYDSYVDMREMFSSLQRACGGCCLLRRQGDAMMQAG